MEEENTAAKNLQQYSLLKNEKSYYQNCIFQYIGRVVYISAYSKIYLHTCK